MQNSIQVRNLNDSFMVHSQKDASLIHACGIAVSSISFSEVYRVNKLKFIVTLMAIIVVIVLLVGLSTINQPETEHLPLADAPSHVASLSVVDSSSASVDISVTSMQEPEVPPKPLHRLIVNGGYSELRELYALLELDYESIEDFLGSDDRFYPNGIQSKADIENLFVSLLGLHFPYGGGRSREHRTRYW